MRLRHFHLKGWTQMAKPLVSDELWELVEPLIPEVERRYRFPGRKRIDDRKVLTGILYVLPPAPSAAAAAWRRPYHSRRPPPRTARPRHQRPISRPKQPHGSGLGTHRWVVERTLSWLHQYRRLRVRYKRRADIHDAFVQIAGRLICLKLLQAEESILLGALSRENRSMSVRSV
jgi:transposase